MPTDNENERLQSRIDVDEPQILTLKYVKSTLKLFIDPKIMKVYGLFAIVSVSTSTHEALLVPFLTDTLGGIPL